MHRRLLFVVLATLLASLLAVSAAAAQDPITLRITWYNDGTEGEALRAALDRSAPRCAGWFRSRQSWYHGFH